MALTKHSAPGAIRIVGWRTPERVALQVDTRRQALTSAEADAGSYGPSPERRARPVQEHQGTAAPLASPPPAGACRGGTAMSSTNKS